MREALDTGLHSPWDGLGGREFSQNGFWGRRVKGKEVLSSLETQTQDQEDTCQNTWGAAGIQDTWSL